MKNLLDTTFDHKDPYRILGVTTDAAPAAIRKAYLQLAKRNHPNLFATDPEKYRASNVMMQDINCAYDLLSDPALRELWDRRHPAAQPRKPRPAPRPTPAQGVQYETEHVSVVIRKYNEFVSSLATAAERQRAVRDIAAFKASREGSAFILELVRSLYQEAIDLLNRDGRISMYDDGLVEMMYLHECPMEIVPSDVFVTYAYILHRENHGKVPAALGRARRPHRTNRADPRAPMLQLRHDPGPAKPAPAKDLGAKVWHWLMDKA